MAKDAQPPDMNEDGLPTDLGDRADDEAARQDYAALWRYLRRADDATDDAFSVDAAWDDLADELGFDAEASAEAAPERPRPVTEPPTARRAPDRPAHAAPSASDRPGWARRLAATALLLLGVGVGLAVWWSQPVTVQTAAGEQTTVTLPDGSTAELNGATTLTYARGFGALPGPLPGHDAAERRVTLRGEAFFSVQPTARPFRVTTRNAVVEVLGTTFSVRARDAAPPVTDVVLTSGRIRLRAVPTDTAAPTAPGVVLAEAGQRSRVEGQAAAPTPPQTIDPKYAAPWRTGGFAARNAALPVILRDLEAQFGTTIRLDVPAAATDTMTLHYGRSVRLEDVLRDIAVVQGLSYRKINRGYELVPSNGTRR